MRTGGLEPEAAVQACRLLMWATIGFVAMEAGAERPTRARRTVRPGGDPGGVTPDETDDLFELHIRYLIEGVARDARTPGAVSPGS